MAVTEVSTMSALGALVRSVRRQAGLSQAELARRAGVTQPWLSRLENGAARAEAQKVLDTLSVLGVRLTASVGDSEQVAPTSHRPEPAGAGADPFADVAERL